ncbi:MAG TPA: ribosome recycling factor [Desulfovibrio sp.]|nr:ribosome recycling factor [Desulfovibrio sp.]
MINEVLADGKKRMEGALTALENDFAKLRTGRAATSLVDNVPVDYYGTPTPINQLASVSIPDSRTISIQPWDKGAFPLIEKALQQSDLGLNPVNDGTVLRITIPPLTEERRKDLVKIAKKYTEDSKIALRNVRRDMNDTLKKLEKDKDISEDEQRKAQDDVQKLTDQYVKKCDVACGEKEKEILEI